MSLMFSLFSLIFSLDPYEEKLGVADEVHEGNLLVVLIFVRDIRRSQTYTGDICACVIVIVLAVAIVVLVIAVVVVVLAVGSRSCNFASQSMLRVCVYSP